ncbi:DUF4177 domain-containing protein [Sedimentitalea sp. JM2-8]|uniref:DUF4177 domain-containing protein n=1 Tax=Sedimentitalea xiamensis TaxID=3050037 RepID=A0ABT7FF57_9RHOB|nr:DUF4177 domain-containing protein [Sedimentitalea xiamensis]MDK3073610.1 DUF4177 domain-containing protein [Sedimentitalea xiamensis]
MPLFEYKVVPAPAKGAKAKGVKTAEGRFALSIEAVLNDMGAAGWEYLRAELLPSEERSGLTGSTTNWRNVLVFRRERDSETEAFRPRLLDAPGAAAPASVPAPSVIADADLAGSGAEEPDTADDPARAEPDAASAERAVLRALRSTDQP